MAHNGPKSTYTEEVGIEIAARIAAGSSLLKVAEDPGMPDVRTMLTWCTKFPEFDQRLAQARLAKADVVFEQAELIADEDVIGTDQAMRQRLRVETRLKIAARLRPERYGEKLGIGAATGLPPLHAEPPSLFEVARRMAFILQAGARQAEAKPLQLAYVQAPQSQGSAS